MTATPDLPATVTDLLAVTWTLVPATGRYIRLDALPYFADRFRGRTLAELQENGPLLDPATSEYVPDGGRYVDGPAPA